MVNRYDFDHGDCYGDCERGSRANMTESEDGEFVLASDYAALESARAALEAELAAASATLERLREVVPEDYLDFDEMHPERDFDDLESTIRAILYPKETDNDLGKCESS